MRLALYRWVSRHSRRIAWGLFGLPLFAVGATGVSHFIRTDDPVTAAVGFTVSALVMSAGYGLLRGPVEEAPR